MRLQWRTDLLSDTPLVRDVALVCLADGIVGVSFGATAVAGGLPWWVPVAMSLLVFAGGSQFAAGAVLNTRLFPYGLAVSDVTSAGGSGGSGARTRRWAARLLGAQLVTDESVAFALRHTDPARRKAAFWTCGAALFTVWTISVPLGVLAGSAMRNTAAFGLDAPFPAVLLALALPTLTDGRTRVAAIGGAGAAVALTPLLPVGLPVLAALGGLAALWRPRRRRPEPEGAGDTRAVRQPMGAPIPARSDR